MVVGESVIFEGTGNDANIDASELTVSFESDKDGHWARAPSTRMVRFCLPTMDLPTMITSFR